MGGPLGRIGRAIGGVFRRRGPPPQRVYREPIGKAPATPYTGPINIPPPVGQQQLALYRVGFDPKQKGQVDPKTGERFLTGTYPTLEGVEGALRRVPDGRMQVRVYGEPAWDAQAMKSPPPDKLGNVYVSYFVSKDVFEGVLATAQDTEDLIYQTGLYNFERVLTVYVGPAR